MTRSVLLGVGVALALLSGCGTSGDVGPTRAADGFEAALTGGDGKAACALLTDAAVEELESSAGQPCEQAVLDEAKAAGDRLEVQRFGTMAEVRFRDDVLFLAEAPGGWRVNAAACKPVPGGRPYDCGIAGG